MLKTYCPQNARGWITAVTITCACAMVAAGSLAFAPARATEPGQDATSKPDKPTINDLAFLAGQWGGSVGGDTAEEHWSHPTAGNIMGMFRWISAEGEIDMLEMLSITEEADGIYLRLVHYDKQLAAWEDEPITLKMRSLEGRLVRFDPVNEGDLESITYDRRQADRLDIVVDFTEESGRAPIVCNLMRLRFRGDKPTTQPSLIR